MSPWKPMHFLDVSTVYFFWWTNRGAARQIPSGTFTRSRETVRRSCPCFYSYAVLFFFKHSSKETEPLLLQLMNPDYFSTFWGGDKGEGWCNDAQSRRRRRWRSRRWRGEDWKVSDCGPFLVSCFFAIGTYWKMLRRSGSLQLPHFKILNHPLSPCLCLSVA